MSAQHRKILRLFSFRRIIIPVLIGLSVTTWLLLRDFSKQKFVKTEAGKGEYTWVDTNKNDEQEVEEFILVNDNQKGDYTLISQQEAFKNIRWSHYTFLWLLIALLMQVIRDFCYMYRIRLLTDNQISWRNSFQVIMLWEFASSVTPSVVGGSAVALYIVNKEGISAGRSTAIVMITAFLDEMFYIVMVPIVFLLAGSKNLFISNDLISVFGLSLTSMQTFVVGYSFIILLNFIIMYGVFINPKGTKWLLEKIFKLPFLKKWKKGAAQAGDDLITTSKEMKGKSFGFWTKAFGSTVLSWTARFWVVNFLILAFTSVSQHLLIYARQLVMWVILLISPTPGSSGVAEYFFPKFLGEFIQPGFSDALAFLWRIFSYYPYLIIGVIILPIWIRRVFFKRKLIRFKSV